ncbi:MAG: hypothetical protein ACYTG5_13440 [Planctomycetota bacterium]|jgi:hypothetical protein
MPNNKPIILRGLWRPTKSEASKLREFTWSKKPLRFKTLFVKGRDPIVVFRLQGRDPVDRIEAGEAYFVSIRGELLRDRKTVRRAIAIYPWDPGLPHDLPEIDLKYLLRPITVLEAWRAARRPVALERTYPGAGGRDRMRRMRGGQQYLIDLHRQEDQSWMGDMQFDWEEMQSRLDLMDAEMECPRPDWKLVAPLRKEHG